MSTGKRIGIVLAVLICIGLYPPLKIKWAERQVTTFCNNVTIGASVEEIERAAQDHWLKAQKSHATMIDGKPFPAMLLVWEGFGFGRWYCEIHHVNEKVESKRIKYLD